MNKEEIEILKTMLLMKINSEKKLILTDEISNYLYNLIVNQEQIERQIKEQEESKQALIEKLRRDIKKAKEIIFDTKFNYSQEVLDDEWARQSYAEELLEFMKGENK